MVNARLSTALLAAVNRSVCHGLDDTASILLAWSERLRVECTLNCICLAGHMHTCDLGGLPDDIGVVLDPTSTRITITLAMVWGPEP